MAKSTDTKRFAVLRHQRVIWDGVEAYRLARNAIVHNAGEFPSSPPQLVQRLLDQYPDDIQYSDGSGLLVKPALIVTFAAACEELLEAVFAKWLALEESRTGPIV